MGVPILDTEALKSLVEKSTRELVRLTHNTGQPAGDIELVDPPVSRIEDISVRVAAEKPEAKLEGVTLIIECLRACCPTTDNLSDEEVWRVLQLGGGANGSLARAALRRVLGVEFAAPNPT